MPLSKLACATAFILFLGAPFRVSVGAQGSDTATVDQALKSPLLAGILEYAVPIAGHAYAGNWKRGIAPGLLRLGAVALLAPAFDCPCESSVEALAETGLLLGAVSIVWGVTSAVTTTQKHNERVRRRLRLSVIRNAHGLAVLADIRR